MKEAWKLSGLFFILVGVILLAAGFFTNRISNLLLGGAMGLIIAGLVGYIIINKHIDNTRP